MNTTSVGAVSSSSANERIKIGRNDEKLLLKTIGEAAGYTSAVITSVSGAGSGVLGMGLGAINGNEKSVGKVFIQGADVLFGPEAKQLVEQNPEFFAAAAIGLGFLNTTIGVGGSVLTENLFKNEEEKKELIPPT